MVCLQKKLSSLKETFFLDQDENVRKVIEQIEEAVRDIAKEIQPQTDIDYWQKFLYETFGNRRIADVQDEDTLVIALAKEAKKTVKLLVGSSPSEAKK